MTRVPDRGVNGTRLPYARVRIEADVAALLMRLLFEEQGRLIQAKIDIRDEGGDTTEVRHELMLLRRLKEEVQRALDELA